MEERMTSIEVPQKQRIGVVGSETTTDLISVDLISDARNRSTNGRMVMIAPEDSEGDQEYAIGTVTGITNRNRHHEDPALRGIIAMRGGIGNLTRRADIKTAKIEVQAAFRAVGNNIRAIGGNMSFAPDTGENVYLLDSSTVRTLAEGVTKDLFYLGNMYRQADVLLPMSVGDFSSARGGSSAAFFGPSGAGKTYCSTTYIAAQMRHERMGFLLIDPQGQFTTDSKVRRELPLDLRALADAQGRDVRQLSVAREVRLPEDAAMFVSMLGGTRFFHANDMLGTTTKSKDVQELVAAWLADQPNWSEKTADELLDSLVEHLMGLARTGSIFSGIKEPEEGETELPVSTKPANRLYHNLGSVLHPEQYEADEGRDGKARRSSLMSLFAPFLNLFSPHGPEGTSKRKRISEIAHEVTDTDIGTAGNRKPRPFFVLTMADKVSGKSRAENITAKALATTKTQGVILRALLSAVEKVAQWRYQETDSPANILIGVDEAARYTSSQARRGDQQELVDDIARYFRELRKYAVGFVLILQEPSALEESIWKQLRNGFRAFAGGLVGNDLEKVREQVGSGGAMRLYEQLAQPSKDNPVYPFMLCGSFSPLAATSSPLFMESFSGGDSAEKWARANEHWLPGVFNVSDLWHGHNTRNTC